MGYTLTFVDMASRTYTLTITTVSGSGTIEGGGATIETTEDADVDMFKPVRCQTGYFRFLTLHNDTNARTKWLNMIPTDSLSRPVKLERGGTTVWQGYIQPQVFENEYPDDLWATAANAHLWPSDGNQHHRLLHSRLEGRD